MKRKRELADFLATQIRFMVVIAKDKLPSQGEIRDVITEALRFWEDRKEDE